MSRSFNPIDAFVAGGVATLSMGVSITSFFTALSSAIFPSSSEFFLFTFNTNTFLSPYLRFLFSFRLLLQWVLLQWQAKWALRVLQVL